MAVTTGKDPSGSKTARQGQGNTFSAGCRFTGNVTFVGPTIVSGRIDGDVDCDGLLIIEAGGAIVGNVTATSIVVHGSLSGGIEARETIEVGSAGSLSGSGYTPCLKVDAGAHMDANLVVSAERSIAHINRSASVPDMSNVSPLTPARAEAAEQATEAALPAVNG